MNTDFEALRAEAEEALAPAFRRIGRIAQKNTEKVLAAFRKNCVAATHFAASDGYGYNDRGRELIEASYAEVFGTEAALVRHSVANGTHALTIGLFIGGVLGFLILYALFMMGTQKRAAVCKLKASHMLGQNFVSVPSLLCLAVVVVTAVLVRML